MSEPFYKVGAENTFNFEYGEEKFHKRYRKTKGKSWKYWDHVKNPIIYEINRLGYRSKTMLPPSGDYFVACGCSNTYGFASVSYTHLTLPTKA